MILPIHSMCVTLRDNGIVEIKHPLITHSLTILRNFVMILIDD
jgi:hypothetical protein